jgi:hypothetical protein
VARKRAPGGGRKPVGKTAARSLLTLRMPDDLRDTLGAEAHKSGSTLTQEVLRRLRESLKESERDPKLRALCFLIRELAGHIVGPSVGEVPLYDWRSDPFFYRAFKIGISQLLDALEPPGPIKAPEFEVNKGSPDPAMKRYLASFESPEARAEYSADYILNALRQAPERTAEQEEEQKKIAALHPSLMREFYGMPSAVRDLAIKQYSGKTTTVTVNMKPIFFHGKEPRGSKS